VIFIYFLKERINITVNNKITVTGANKVFLLVAVVNIIYSFAVGIAFPSILDNNMLLLLIMIQFYCVLFPSLFYMIGNKINIKETLRFNSPGLLPSFLIVLMSGPAFYTASALNSIVYYILQFIGDGPEGSSIPVPQNLEEVILSIVVIAVAPALCEEILHRGILLKAYEYRGTMKAVVISGIMFGFFHFDITNLLGPIFLGVLFGYYVVRTNSIFAGTIAHFMNNFLATVLQYLMREVERDSDFYTLQDLSYTLILGAISAVFVFLLLLCFKMATKERATVRKSGTTILNDVCSIFSHWPVVVVLALYIVFTVLYLISL